VIRRAAAQGSLRNVAAQRSLRNVAAPRRTTPRNAAALAYASFAVILGWLTN
jgi:hypothetical protein